MERKNNSKSRRIIAIALAATLGCPAMIAVPSAAFADETIPQIKVDGSSLTADANTGKTDTGKTDETGKDQTDTTVKDKTVTISQKDLKGTTGWYATDKDHAAAPKPSDISTPGGLNTLTAGKYLLSYKVTDKTTQASEATYTIVTVTSVDKDGKVSYENKDAKIVKIKDGDTTPITLPGGGMLIIPKGDANTLGDFTLTTVTDTAPNPDPDKNDGKDDTDKNDGKDDQKTDQTQAAYTFDLSTVPNEAATGLNGSLGIVAVTDPAKDTPKAVNPKDRKNNPYTVETQYVGVTPGTYRITYRADKSKNQLGAANGGLYDRSETDRNGIFGAPLGAKYQSVKVEADWWKPADGKAPTTQLTVTLAKGAFLTFSGGSDMGTLVFERVKDGATDQNKDQDKTQDKDKTVTDVKKTDGKASTTADEQAKLAETGSSTMLMAVAGLISAMMGGLAFAFRRRA